MNRHRFLVAILGGSLLVGLSGPAIAVPLQGSKILFITSNQHTYGDTTLNTANHFAEIVVAYDIFKRHGIAVDFVSPNGGAIPLGYIETSNPTQKDHLYNADFMAKLKNTLKPGQVRAADYQAVYYSGGGAAMFGVPSAMAPPAWSI